ncbi:hypothetical protein ABT010_39580 [Streptomyces sp. NPDC002668]|uniref:hypothetical protein n=1 Tax=Streptomyces sp. NPDC002668 TaxID=3154422 RepID=UPI00333433C0
MVLAQSRLRRAALLAIVVAAAAVFLALRPDRHPSPRAVYAYTTADSVVVMDGDRTVHREKRPYSSSNEPARWTANGDRLFYLALPRDTLDENDDTQDALAAQQLVVIDALKGTVRRLPCPQCTSAGPAGGNRVLAYQADRTAESRLLAFDLASADPPIQFPLTSTQPPGNIRLLAGLPDNVLLAANDPAITGAYGGPESLLLLDGEGTLRPAGSTGSDTFMSVVAAGRPSSSKDKHVALVATAHASACETTNTVSLLDSRTGRTQPVSMSSIRSASTSTEPRGLEVRDLWWDQDGHLYATITAWRCDYDVTEQVVTTVPPSLWRLDGTHWTKVMDDPVAKVRRLQDGAELRLAAAPVNSVPSGSELRAHAHGTSKVVARGVFDLSLP